ncbi:hypothetical protein S1OALGB6SA_2030 [Olavius algarvensis spirochete endosymbiont]|nr:hypothetical protein S1OALGB6SA_2030 [Olavius algarvensis spirochete endosymbiont]
MPGVYNECRDGGLKDFFQVMMNRVKIFSKKLVAAQSLMARGGFREAFAKVVDIPVNRPDELFSKIALMADSGIALRDASILKYGLYLMECHSRDILAIPSYSPYLWFNIANLRTNLLSVKESEGAKRCWYNRNLTAPAREAYTKAFEKAEGNKTLRMRILNAHARLLLGLGRDWEAFSLFHMATRLDSNNQDGNLGRVETLAALAGTAPALETELLKEAYVNLNSVDFSKDDSNLSELIQNLKLQLEERLGNAREAECTYPKNTILTNSDQEHFMVMFSLNNRLYLTPCASCRICDRAVGDAATLGAHHALVGGKAAGRYRKAAILTGRLIERYRALRAALINHVRKIELQDGAEFQPHCPELDDWQPVHSSTTALITALAGSPAILEGMASCVALFLDRDFTVPLDFRQILGSSDTPGTNLVNEKNPALHGFWDLWIDGMEGFIKGAELPELLSQSLASPESERLSLNSEELTAKALGLVGWFRNLIGYLIRMADREARGEIENPPLWPLQTFVLPGE